ncbi:MAG: hypothetical protein NTX75_02140 [Proteobacteria bacterium]|nr:hypothetical protein [Pseudomonadota bacterium]
MYGKKIKANNFFGHKGADNTSVTIALSSIGDKWKVVWGWDNGTWSAKHATFYNGVNDLEDIFIMQGFNPDSVNPTLQYITVHLVNNY